MSIGNDDYHNDKICICNEWGEADGNRGYEENQTIFLIENEYEGYIGQIENEESVGDFEYSDEMLEKMLTKKQKTLFNSNLGDIYYKFFQELPDFIKSLHETYPNGYYLKDLKKFVQEQYDTNGIYIDIL